MFNKKTILTLITLFALVISICAIAIADTPLNTEEMILPSNLNPFEYRTAPDGKYVFIYYGYAPYFSVEIDTSECEIDRLYVYDAGQQTVTKICDQAVAMYTATKDCLYYATSAQKIYKTDYWGTNHEQLYECEQGALTKLSCYLTTLYFIENGNQVVYLDATTKQSQVVLSQENLDWVFLLSETELVTGTPDEIHTYYNFFTKETVGISSIEATNRINAAISAWENTENPDVSPMALFNPFSVTQENDISLPLSAYPVTYHDNDRVFEYDYRRPISWFHNNGEEGCFSGNCKNYGGSNECEGFARYAHDAYLHIVDNSIVDNSWLQKRHTAKEYRYNGNTEAVKGFFETLYTGDYVRYAKSNDESPEDGAHSIVFVARDDNGIWAYEANQPYYEGDYYGCGVFLQYYKYSFIAEKYSYIHHYISHNLYGERVCEDAFTHIIYCTGCNGYIRQDHPYEEVSYYDEGVDNQHIIFFRCCNAYLLETHDFNGQTYWDDYTHTFYCVYCSAYQQVNHNFNIDRYTPISLELHTACCDDCGAVIYQPHTTVGVVCIYCDLSLLNPEFK